MGKATKILGIFDEFLAYLGCMYSHIGDCDHGQDFLGIYMRDMQLRFSIYGAVVSVHDEYMASGCDEMERI